MSDIVSNTMNENIEILNKKLERANDNVLILLESQIQMKEQYQALMIENQELICENEELKQENERLLDTINQITNLILNVVKTEE